MLIEAAAAAAARRDAEARGRARRRCAGPRRLPARAGAADRGARRCRSRPHRRPLRRRAGGALASPTSRSSPRPSRRRSAARRSRRPRWACPSSRPHSARRKRRCLRRLPLLPRRAHRLAGPAGRFRRARRGDRRRAPDRLPVERPALLGSRARGMPGTSRPRRCRARRSPFMTASCRQPATAPQLSRNDEAPRELTCLADLPDSSTSRWQARPAPPILPVRNRHKEN